MRSLVAGIVLVSIIGAMILVSYIVVEAMGAEMSSGSAAGDEASSRYLSRGPRERASLAPTRRPRARRTSAGFIEGAPTVYELPGDGVTGVNVVRATIQQQESAGALRVEILDDGRVIQAQQTSAASSQLNLTYSQ